MRIAKTIIYIALILVMIPVDLFASPVKVFVNSIVVVGNVSNKEETKSILKALIAARLADEQLLPVTVESEADASIMGTYVVIGNQYSIDLVLINRSGKALTRKALQGTESNPSLFKVSELIVNEIKPEVLNLSSFLKANSQPSGVGASIEPGTDRIVSMKQASHDIVRSRKISSSKHVIDRVPRITGEFTMIRLSPDEKTLFLTGRRSISALDRETRKTVSTTELDVGSIIINMDILEVDSSNETYLFVTYVNMSTVFSDVFKYEGEQFKKILNKAPYYTKVLRTRGKTSKLYIQEQGVEAERYFGPVFEATWDKKNIIKGSPKKMPRYGDIYNFNEFNDSLGDLFTVVFDENAHLMVYDSSYKPVWKSNDKFGGSELSFSVRDINNVTKTGKEYRMYFMNQRIEVTPGQEVLVGYNDGTFVVGDSRTYKKGTVFNFVWNGSALEEVWRTKETQNYMPDFEYDPKTKTIYQLQLVQREDPFKGDSAMSSVIIKKVE